MNRVTFGEMQEKTSTASFGIKSLMTVRVDEISMSTICASAIPHKSTTRFSRHRHPDPATDAILTTNDGPR
ncbi:hypothetical protein [Rhizobium sp. BR 362]|uniref:hypothetical protein n=1 Tax=Rhizobium sp. BR 362 TaxID=3040670 RepID=UPI002F412700